MEPINNDLIMFLEKILHIGASSKGDNFDETIKKQLEKNLKRSKILTTEMWSGPEYKEYKTLTQEKRFNFNSIKEPADIFNDPSRIVIVDKPNGSQQWPDLLIIYKNIGFPIEIKSSKNDHILWNSGYPRAKSLYIFNCYGYMKTTIFLGEHSLCKEDAVLLLKIKNDSSESNCNLPNGSYWSYYSRHMFNSSQKFFESESLEKKSLKNPDKKVEYEEQKRNRFKREAEVFQFIKNLTWDDKQCTDFSDKALELNYLNNTNHTNSNLNGTE